MKMIIDKSKLNPPVRSQCNEDAWDEYSVREILEQVLRNKWIVLGGDVVNSNGRYTPTYDSWYYLVDESIPLEENCLLSVQKCIQYMENFIERNGQEYYFVLTISDKYVGATGIPNKRHL